MMLKKYMTFFVAALALILSATLYAQSTAPDSTSRGSYTVASGEYRFIPTIDATVMPDRMTEIWAKVYYPKEASIATNKAPLIVMLHGNHATCGIGSNPRADINCDYTDTGICPTGYVPVPNHEGYQYLADNLASWGYWVVSINANRGINCGAGVDNDFGLNLARGRLVLKHLSLLYKWSTEGGAPASIGLGPQGFVGKIDFGAVGLFGHSRGGEGVRAAYNLYSDLDSEWPVKIPGLAIKAIFEVGAVDGQTSRVLDANGIVWNQLLPLCDGDVYDLQGRYPFERMLLNSKELPTAQKSLYEVSGANHNFFNTEWQSSDATACEAGGPPIFDPTKSSSPKQQKIALASVPAFFRSHLGSNIHTAFNQNFNPLTALPRVVTEITKVDRDFTPSPGRTETEVIEDFDKETGTNSSGKSNLANQIEIDHMNLGPYQRVARIKWEAAGRATFFEAIWTDPSQGRDIHSFATLDFRVGRRIDDPLNSDLSTHFGIALEEASGRFSTMVKISDYATINEPASYNPVLQTVRIPLSAFHGVDLTKIRGVKFMFDQTQTGALWLANIRVQRQVGLGGTEKNKSAQTLSTTRETPRKWLPTYVEAHLNSIRSIRTIGMSHALAGKPAVEIRVTSQVPFPVMNRLPVLKIGDKTFLLSRYSDLSTLKELVFTLSIDEYNALAKNSEVTVLDGKVWRFGLLGK
jgi:hypothetical protein